MMEVKYFLTTVLIVLMYYTLTIGPVQAAATKCATCENYTCEAGRECFLKKTKSTNSSCQWEPSCRPSCAIIRCRGGFNCENGQCVPSCELVDCKPGEKCVLEKVDCLVPPCPSLPTCKPVDKCSYVRCSSGYKCINGTCVCDKNCGPGQECYLRSVQCIRAPCNPVPSCRPILTCATINCISGYICVDRKCIPAPTCKNFTCPPGQQCYLKTKECITAPCPPPEPVCRGSCANILCPTSTNCIDGECLPIKAIREKQE